MSRRLIEFYANEEKDWAFHCHLLYHMHAGMMKVLSYDDQGVDHEPKLDLKMENPFYFLVDGSIQSQMSMGFARLMNTRNDFGINWESGWQHTDPRPGIEYEIEPTWQRYINMRWMTFTGLRFTNLLNKHNSLIAGVTHRLPYMVDAQFSVESTGNMRFGLLKTFQLTSRLSVFTRVEYDTNSAQGLEWLTWTNYTLSKNLGLITSYSSDYGLGAGLSYRF